MGTVTSVKLIAVSAFSVHSSGHVVAPRDHPHAAVVLVAGVERQPRRHAGPGLHAQVEVVLVQGLPARAGRLEVQHRLHGVGLASEQARQPGVDARVEQPAQAEVVPAVHVDQPRVARERVGTGGVHAREVAGIRAVAAQRHVVLAVLRHLVGPKQAARHDIPVL